MAVFEHSTVDAVAAARSLHEEVAELDEADPLRLRVGISAGEVTPTEDGDLLGGPVITAARLCAAAPAGPPG